MVRERLSNCYTPSELRDKQKDSLRSELIMEKTNLQKKEEMLRLKEKKIESFAVNLKQKEAKLQKKEATIVADLAERKACYILENEQPAKASEDLQNILMDTHAFAKKLEPGA